MSNAPDKRRVAVFRNNFLPYSETFIHDELRCHERYEPTVFARQQRNRDAFPGHRVVAVETLPDAPHPVASAVYGLTARSPRLGRAFAAGGFDIVHAHFGHNGLYALPFARRHRVPLVVSLHGRDVTVLAGRDKYHPAWWHYLLGYRRLFAQAALFLAASEDLRRLIVACGCPAQKVVVHRLGIDLARFTPPAARPANDPPLVVMVGRFVEKKGHLDGLAALAAVRAQGHAARLVLVGDGPLRPRYEQRIGELGLVGSVELPGPLPHAEIARLLATADVLLAPSAVARNLDRDSGIIVAKEAAATGLPVIGTVHGGIPDIIEDGVTGFLVPEHDVPALGDRLARLLADRDLARTLGAAGRAKMEREYDLAGRVRALETLYDDVISRSRP